MSDYLQRAQFLMSQSRYELAAKELRHELTSNPDDPLPHALLALCLSELKQHDEAESEAGLAIMYGPHISFCHYVMAQVLLARDKHKEAELVAREAIRLDPDDADYFALLASILMQQRRWQDALDAAEEGIQLDAEHTGCANLRAMALVQLGRQDEAGATIYATLALDPENAFTHANQGWAYLHKGEQDKALEHFREALRLNPGLDWARNGMIEALKAKNLIYRLMLRYFLWMSRLSGNAQWFLVIGGYMGSRVLRSIADTTPALAPLIWPLLIVYFVFVYLTWAADPIFNLLLRVNRFGRMMLTRKQILASNIVGGLLLTALIAGLLYLTWQSSVLLMLALGCVAMVIPVAGTFNLETDKGRRALGVYTIVLAAIGALAIATAILNGVAAATTLGGIFLFGIFIFGWVANSLAIQR